MGRRDHDSFELSGPLVAVTDFLRTLERAGFTSRHMSRVMHDRRLAKKIVELLDGREPLEPEAPNQKLPRPDLPIDQAGLKTPLVNILKKYHVNTLGDLATCTVGKVRSMTWIGVSRISQIERALAGYSMHLADRRLDDIPLMNITDVLRFKSTDPKLVALASEQTRQINEQFHSE